MKAQKVNSDAKRTQLGATKGTAGGRATGVGLDSVATKNAINAPKKTSEALGNAQKGTGGTPKVGLDSVGLKNAVNAPKPVSEGLGTAHKGHHGTAPRPAEGGAASYEQDHSSSHQEPAYEASGGYEEQAEGGYEQQGEEQQYEYQEGEYEEEELTCNGRRILNRKCYPIDVINFTKTNEKQPKVSLVVFNFHIPDDRSSLLAFQFLELISPTQVKQLIILSSIHSPSAQGTTSDVVYFSNLTPASSFGKDTNNSSLIKLDGHTRLGHSFFASLVHLVQLRNYQTAVLLGIPSKSSNDRDMLLHLGQVLLRDLLHEDNITISNRVLENLSSSSRAITASSAVSSLYM